MNFERAQIKSLFVFVAAVLLTAGITLSAQDPVRNAIRENEEKVDRKIVDEGVAEFLVRAAENRLMNINESKLAVLKGATSDVRNYGQLMIMDQTAMLEEIRKIAGERGITLPDGVSDKKREGQMDLSEESGKAFDEKFLKMIESGLERDIKLFENAKNVNDDGVVAFVKEHLPLIQSHLQQLQDLKE